MQNKVLIVGPAWVGDMVMAQCLFKVLKQQNPLTEIDVLAPSWSEALLSRMPEVSSSLVMPIGHGQLQLGKRYGLAKLVREKRYNQAIILPNSFKSALIPWLAAIPVRTGWRGEMRYVVLNDLRKLDKKKYPLMIERFMALGLQPNAALPQDYPLPALRISEASQLAALNAHQLEIKGQPILALCPGAEFGPAKRWPETHYAEVARAKLDAGWQVWLLGSAKDQSVTQEIMALTNQGCVDLAGKTHLAEAIDLLSLASGVVSNDSGLMHIAAALKKPLVAVYGPTTAAFTPPLHLQAARLSLSLDCQPCFKRECPLMHHHCMKELHPQRVLHAMSEWSL